jgi:hypothetical protein
MSEQKHVLQIHNLKYLDADCTCGSWSIACAAFNHQDIGEIRDRARREFQTHLNNVRKTNRTVSQETELDSSAR